MKISNHVSPRAEYYKKWYAKNPDYNKGLKKIIKREEQLNKISLCLK